MGQWVPSGKDITHPETELAEAKWFGLAEVEHALDHGANPMWEPPIKG